MPPTLLFCAVIFSDIVSFTDISRQLTPEKGGQIVLFWMFGPALLCFEPNLPHAEFCHNHHTVCDMLDRLYIAMDGCARKHQIFKVETIGDGVY